MPGKETPPKDRVYLVVNKITKRLMFIARNDMVDIELDHRNVLSDQYTHSIQLDVY